MKREQILLDDILFNTYLCEEDVMELNNGWGPWV